MQTTEVSLLNIPAAAMWFFWGLIVLISLATSVLNILNTKSRRERVLTFQSCVVVWFLLVAVVAVSLYVHDLYKWIALGALVILFPLVVYQSATRRQLLRILEEREKNRGRDSKGQGRS